MFFMADKSVGYPSLKRSQQVSTLKDGWQRNTVGRFLFWGQFGPSLFSGAKWLLVSGRVPGNSAIVTFLGW